MELNKLSELYTKICQKYNFDQIDLNRDKQITEDEIIKIAEYDEEISANLDSSEIEMSETTSSAQNSTSTESTLSAFNSLLSGMSENDLKPLIMMFCMLLKSYSSNGVDILSKLESLLSANGISEISDVQQVQQLSSVQNTGSTGRAKQIERKSLEEYFEIIDSKLNEVLEKTGSKDKAHEYVKNNMAQFTDIDGDGQVTKIDAAIWEKYSDRLNNLYKTADNKAENLIKLNAVKSIKSTLNSCGTNYGTSQYDSYLYTLQDLKDLKNFGGSFSVNDFQDKLDYAELLKEDNWEEKLEEIADLFDLKGVYLERIKERAAAFSEAVNNSENKQYALLAAEYKIRMAKVNSGEFKFSDIVFLSPSTVDFNNDGKVDAKDFLLFPDELDLDGDGKISDREKNYLRVLKNKMEVFIRTNAVLDSSNNSTSIDSLLNYLENFDDEAFAEKQISKIHNSPARKGWKLEALWRHKLDPGTVLTAYTGLMDGSKDDVIEMKYDSNSIRPLDFAKNRFAKQVKSGSPNNTYLHYIKSADLSKEELTEILNKINASSSRVRHYLSEVIYAIEQKLDAIK